MTITGKYCNTIHTQHASFNNGLAINSDGSVMAVSTRSNSSHCVTLYSLPSGIFLRSVGVYGKAAGQFRGPEKLCFSPTTGNLLVADGWNQRVQVCVVFPTVSFRSSFTL